MLSVLIPYAGSRHPDVVAGAPPGASWVDVSGDNHAYWRALADAWGRCAAAGDDLLIIEHDVVCRPDVVEQFQTCADSWCLFGYDTMCCEPCQEAWANHLGCTRFRVELIRACRDAVLSIPPELRDWHNLCDHLAGDKIDGTPTPTMRAGSLRAAGFTHHFHEPHVCHNPEKGAGGDGHGRHSTWAGHPRSTEALAAAGRG